MQRWLCKLPTHPHSTPSLIVCAKSNAPGLGSRSEQPELTHNMSAQVVARACKRAHESGRPCTDIRRITVTTACTDYHAMVAVGQLGPDDRCSQSTAVPRSARDVHASSLHRAAVGHSGDTPSAVPCAGSIAKVSVPLEPQLQCRCFVTEGSDSANLLLKLPPGRGSNRDWQLFWAIC